MVSEVDRAYLAAFIDGEGYIYIGKVGERLQLKMAVVNTCLAALRELQLLWGGSIAKKKRSSEKHKQAYELRWFKETPTIISEVLFYLKIKKEQARIGLQFALTGDYRGGVNEIHLPNTVIEQRKNLQAQMQEVNRRGEQINKTC